MAEEQVLAYKCPNCNASLQFDAKTNDLYCEYCGGHFSVEQSEKAVEESENGKNNLNPESYRGEVLEGLTEFSCTSCGAKIAGDANTAATTCPYCGNPVILNNRVSDVLRPDGIIPFKLTREQAKQSLSSFYKKKILLPKSFKNENNIEKVTGIYVPFWLYDSDVKARATFRATRVSSWRQGDYRYTKTDHFLVTRAATMRFEKLPVDASLKMDDSYMDALEPFDYRDYIPFGTVYLSGYFADKYDQDEKECAPRAYSRMHTSAVAELRSSVRGYSSVITEKESVVPENSRTHYAMLPVYLLQTAYHGQSYLFAMNGQTGKFAGKLPVSKGRFIALLSGVFAACMVIAQIFLLMGGIL